MLTIPSCDGKCHTMMCNHEQSLQIRWKQKNLAAAAHFISKTVVWLPCLIFLDRYLVRVQERARKMMSTLQTREDCRSWGCLIYWRKDCGKVQTTRFAYMILAATGKKLNSSCHGTVYATFLIGNFLYGADWLVLAWCFDAINIAIM